MSASKILILTGAGLNIADAISGGKVYSTPALAQVNSALPEVQLPGMTGKVTIGGWLLGVGLVLNAL